MLTKYKISNFKAFKDINEVPLRPITLIYGQNSAGKSSIIQSLLLLKQSLNINHSSICLKSQGDFVDLGDYKNFVNSHNSRKNVTINLTFFSQDILDFLKPHIERFSLSEHEDICCLITIKNQNGIPILDKVSIYIENDSHPILSYSVFIDRQTSEEMFILEKIDRRCEFWKAFLHNHGDDILDNYYSRTRKKFSELFGIDPQKLRDKSSVQDELKKTQESIEDEIKELEFKLISLNNELEENKDNIDQSTYDLDNLKHELDNLNLLSPILKEQQLKKRDILGRVVECIHHFYRVKSHAFLPNELIEEEILSPAETLILDISYEVYTEDISIISFISDFTKQVTQKLDEILGDLIYIAPLRCYPERFHIAGANVSSPEDMLYNNLQILEKINEIFARFKLNYEVKISSPNIAEKPEFDRLFSIRLTDTSSGTKFKHSISIKDVGFGVSQVLPVLIQSLLYRDTTLIIEQPEIHIHPRLQADLAEVFAESYMLYKNHFLIETHSENLILRFQKLIREKTEIGDSKRILTNKDISVIYVDREEDSSYCVELRLDEDGEFIDSWPNGFFEESFNELF